MHNTPLEIGGSFFKLKRSLVEEMGKYSVTRLGDFKYNLTNYITKIAQIFGNFFGLFEKLHFKVKCAVASLALYVLSYLSLNLFLKLSMVYHRNLRLWSII